MSTPSTQLGESSYDYCYLARDLELPDEHADYVTEKGNTHAEAAGHNGSHEKVAEDNSRAV